LKTRILQIHEIEHPLNLSDRVVSTLRLIFPHLFFHSGPTFQAILPRPTTEHVKRHEGTCSESNRRRCDRDSDEDQNRNRPKDGIKKPLRLIATEDRRDKGEDHQDADDDAHDLSRPQQVLGEVVFAYAFLALTGMKASRLEEYRSKELRKLRITGAELAELAIPAKRHSAIVALSDLGDNFAEIVIVAVQRVQRTIELLHEGRNDRLLLFPADGRDIGVTIQA
jgi:hypothetical protein